MKSAVINYFELAKKLAISKDDHRAFFVGSIATRNDGTIVGAINGPTTFPDRRAHAEYRVSRKMDYGSVVYVVRVRKDNGDFAMARPCKFCQKALLSHKVHKVCYTIDKDNWGVWFPKTSHDVLYKFSATTDW